MENKTSAFLRRLRLYLMGVGLGCVLVYFLLLRGKNFDGWFPSKRVLDYLRKSELVYSYNTECWMNCMGISTEQIEKIIDSTGVVNFDESNTGGKCPIYSIEDGERFKVKLTISVCDSVANVLALQPTEALTKPCECE
jgi:hypothetical protein